MIKVTVTSTDVRNQRGVAKASGKPYNMNFQTVWAHTLDKSGNPNPFPEKTEVILETAEDGAALFHPPGEYTLHPSSVYVDRNGNIALAPRLVPIPKARAAA